MAPSNKTYRVSHQFIHAWYGGGPYHAGYCVCEVREYEDGSVHVWRGDPIYIADKPQVAELHQIYLLAAHALKREAERHSEGEK